MAASINRVVLVGNLTRDPELRHTPSGTPVCSLRLAVNTRRKDESGQWTDKPNYFDITVWGQQGENCAQYLSKGRPVAIDGRLEWREWEAQDGAKRQAVEVVAESVQFLGGRQDGESSYVPAGATASTGGAGGGDDFPTSPTDDDIPFLDSDCGRKTGDVASASISGRAKIPKGGCFAAATQLIQENREHGTEETATAPAHRPADGSRQAQELPLLPGQGRGDRLQEPRAAAPLHLGEGEDPVAPHHRRVPSSPDPGRCGGEARARDGSPPLRRLMEVILLQDVEKLGLRGEVVDVARGYARNFLLPRRLAENATPARVAELRKVDAQRAKHEARTAEQAQEIAELLGKTVLRFEVKAGPTGSLFGSVTPSDIADEIWRTRKVRVDRRKIATDPLKRIGRFSIPIELFADVEVEVKTLVVPEGGELPPEEELAAIEAAEAEAKAAEAAAVAAAAAEHKEAEQAIAEVLAEEEVEAEEEAEAEGESDVDVEEVPEVDAAAQLEEEEPPPAAA